MSPLQRKPPSLVPTILATLTLFNVTVAYPWTNIQQWPNSTFPQPPQLQFPTALEPLKFKQDGTFQISIFEDLHFGENAWDTWGPQQDLATLGVINNLLESESSTDLVVLNGDLITGENTYLENATSYLDMIVKPIAAHGKTWASTYGNHDHQYNITGETIFQQEKKNWPKNSRTKNMVQGGYLAGTSNYYLPVYPADCDPSRNSSANQASREEEFAANCTPALILWFFDSKGGFRYQQKHPINGKLIGLQNWVDQSVVDWWLRTNNQLQSRWYSHTIPPVHNSSLYNSTKPSPIPSLAFVHIPPYASLLLQNSGVNPNTEPGINDDIPLAPQAQGWCPSGVNDGTCAYGGQDTPFMKAITTIPGLLGVFSGHDHGNTWCYKWDRQLPGMAFAGNGVNLCFGQHTGYGGYGSWERGGRQILVSRDGLTAGEVDTWIRLEGGGVVGRVGLNATYGVDEYPATRNTKTKCPTCNYDVVTPMPGTRS